MSKLKVLFKVKYRNERCDKNQPCLPVMERFQGKLQGDRNQQADKTRQQPLHDGLDQF